MGKPTFSKLEELYKEADTLEKEISKLNDATRAVNEDVNDGVVTVEVRNVSFKCSDKSLLTALESRKSAIEGRLNGILARINIQNG